MQGEWLRATLSEAWSDFTLLVVIGFLVAAAVRARAPGAVRSRASMRWTFAFLILHLASLPLLGYLSVEDHDAYESVRLFSLTLEIFAGVTIILAIVFDGILRGLKAQAPRIVQDVVAATSYLIGGFFLLSAWGVNLSGLIATSAVLTAVIGFALQDTLGNLIGGMALQMEKSIRPGDWIRVGDKEGRVLEIRWRQTTIETRDWESIIVPNSLLAKAQFIVLGRRHGEPLQLRRSVLFHIDFRHAPDTVISAVETALRRAPIPGVAQQPAPDCVLIDMRDSYSTFSARYYLTDLVRDAPVDSDVRARIFAVLQRAGIPLTMPAQAIFLTAESEERRERLKRDQDRTREEVLRGTDMFKDLEEAELQELAAALRFSPYRAGEVMTRQGDEGRDLFFIHQGRISVRIRVLNNETEVAQLEAGAFFGERSLMTGETRSATTVALTNVVCYRLAKASLQSLLQRRPALAEGMAEVLARRDAERDVHRQGLSGRAATERLEADRRQLVSKIRNFFGL